MMYRTFNSNLKIAALSACALVFAACGRDTVVYPDASTTQQSTATTPAAPSTTTTNTTITITDGQNVLPNGFFDQSVNAAVVDLALDGSSATSVAIRLQTKPEAAGSGGYNGTGTGTGNSALLGNSRYSKALLSSVTLLNFDSYTYAGLDEVGVLLQVDLKCDGTTAPRVLMTDTTALDSTAAAVSATSDYSTFNAGLDQNVWQVSGAAIVDPTNSHNILVPSASGTSTSTLQALIASYPQACIVNGVSLDANLPAGLPVAGILFRLGSTTEENQNGAFIDHIVIGSDVYDSSQWGTNQ